jgi:hypothetical protein
MYNKLGFSWRHFNMKRRKQILLFISCFIILSLACNLPAIIMEQIRIFFQIPIMVEEDPIGVEANESTSEPAVENAGEPADENVNELVEEMSIEDCLAESDEYAWEFANVNNDNSNDTKQVCQGDFIMRNTSDKALYLKLYEYRDNGAMQDIGWQMFPIRLEPGEAFSLYFGTQAFSTGPIPESVVTFTKLSVFYALPECALFPIEEAYEAFWDASAEPLTDPCR